jgi:pilus assembly protein FimV
LKINRFTAILVLFLPNMVLSMGLGEIKVDSYLNQPFRAEIPLLDVGGVPLEGIKATLASLEEFERVGLDRNQMLELLNFQVRRNQNGRAVIDIWSNERISEPYLQILVDLAWANGQLYRSYTILLDPPGYKLEMAVTHIGSAPTYRAGEPGVVEKPVYTHATNNPIISKSRRAEATYGPTLANESIWEIAQRYSTPDTTLPQVILAIVGTNSQAFTQGNLNGLKVGERLRIPSNDEVLKIPADLAKLEVDAHDVAWKTKQEIKHVLLPPYIDGVTGVSQFDKAGNGLSALASKVAEAPVFQGKEVVKTSLPHPEITLPAKTQEVTTPISYLPQPVNMNGPKTVSSAVFESVSKENAALKKQIGELEANKTALQKVTTQESEEAKKLREQNEQIIKEREALKAQVAELGDTEESSNFWLYVLVIGALAGGLGYLVYLRRKDEDSDVSSLEVNVVMPVNPVPAPLPSVEVVKSSDSTDEKDISGQEEVAAPEPESILSEKIDKRVDEALSSSESDESQDKSDVAISALATKEEQAITSHEPIAPPLPPEPLEESVDDSPVSAVEDTQHEPSPEVAEYHDDEAPVSDDKVNIKQEKIKPKDNLLDFEPGLDQFIAPDAKEENINHNQQSIDFVTSNKKSDTTSAIPKESKEDKSNRPKGAIKELEELSKYFAKELDAAPVTDNGLENKFDFSEDNVEPEEAATEEPDTTLESKPAKPVKSKAALDTLLALAKTYIAMEDLETAKQSLQEVLDFGDGNQKAEAQKIMDELNSR